MRRSEIIPIFDPQTTLTYRVVHHIVENIVVTDEPTKQEVEDQVITQIKISLQITHIVQCLYYIELQQLNHLEC